MLLGIDHLVIAVDDVDAAAADVETGLGLVATGGGRHESGTHNRLVFLGDTYLELIAPWDRARALGHPIGAAVVRALDAGNRGLVTFALATDDIGRDVAALRSAGSAIAEPVRGSRVRPDGAEIAWQAAVPPLLGHARPPFLIEHVLDGPEWSDQARGARAAFVHPFGGQARLAGIELVVADPRSTAGSYAATLDVAMLPGPGPMPGVREGTVGPHVIRLVPRECCPRGPTGALPRASASAARPVRGPWSTCSASGSPGSDARHGEPRRAGRRPLRSGRGRSCGRQGTARSTARRRTSSSMAPVKRPVKVFCWLGW